MSRRRQYVKETGQWVPAVWCSQHDEHPSDCWELHHMAAAPAIDTQADNWQRWLGQAWDRIDSEVQGETPATGARAPVEAQRDGMDPAGRGRARHGDEVA